MEPLLLDHDVVLVDCSKTEIIDGRIYAFVFGNALRVKRLYRKIWIGLTRRYSKETTN